MDTPTGYADWLENEYARVFPDATNNVKVLVNYDIEDSMNHQKTLNEIIESNKEKKVYPNDKNHYQLNNVRNNNDYRSR